MQPLPLRAAADIFTLLADPKYSSLQLWVSCFEIYSGKLYDLLNNRKRLEAREDGKKTVQIVGLKEVIADTVSLTDQNLCSNPMSDYSRVACKLSAISEPCKGMEMQLPDSKGSSVLEVMSLDC